MVKQSPVGLTHNEQDIRAAVNGYVLVSETFPFSHPPTHPPTNQPTTRAFAGESEVGGVLVAVMVRSGGAVARATRRWCVFGRYRLSTGGKHAAGLSVCDFVFVFSVFFGVILFLVFQLFFGVIFLVFCCFSV